MRRRIVDRSRGNSERPTSSQPCKLREFACGGREFVVGDHHGLGAVLHGCARHHFLNGTRADWPGLPFALNGKAIGPLADDDVDTPVAGDRRHDHWHPAGPGDPRDVVLEFGPRQLGRFVVGVLTPTSAPRRKRGAAARTAGARAPIARLQKGVAAEEVGGNAERHGHNHVEPRARHGRMVGRRADIAGQAQAEHRLVRLTNGWIWFDAGAVAAGLICTT